MIKNMLQAASKMLAQSKEEKVVCAKIIIDEIVAGMEPKTDDWPMIPVPIVKMAEEEAPKQPKKKPSATEPKGKIMVEHGKIVSIEGVDLATTMVELDGKVMTCAEAIGKPFQNGRFV